MASVLPKIVDRLRLVVWLASLSIHYKKLISVCCNDMANMMIL